MTEVHLPLHRKQLIATVVNDKLGGFKQKLKIFRTCIHHCECESFPVLKNFSGELTGEISGDSNKRDFFKSYHEMYQILQKSCMGKNSIQSKR